LAEDTSAMKPRDQALDLSRWQVVTGDGVRLTEIAADHGRTQFPLSSPFRLRGVKPADYLSRAALPTRSKMALAMSPG
jgi:hypothetical protein